MQSREKREERWKEEQAQREQGHNPMAASQGVSSGNAAQATPKQTLNAPIGVPGVPQSPLNPPVMAQRGSFDTRGGEDAPLQALPQATPFQTHSGGEGPAPAAPLPSPFQAHGAQPVQLEHRQPAPQPGMAPQHPGAGQPVHPGMGQPVQAGIGMGQPPQSSPVTAAPAARAGGPGMIPGQRIPGQPGQRSPSPMAQQVHAGAPQQFPPQSMQPQQSFQAQAPAPQAPVRLEVERVPNPPDLEEQLARAQAQPVDLTVFVTCFRRPHLLRPQVEALQSSTARPQGVVAWVNGAGQVPLDEAALNQTITVASPINWGPWQRFMFALEATTEYVLILDDDCIPGTEWIQTALEAMQEVPAVYACVGGYYGSDDANELSIVGPGQGLEGHEGLLPVDVGLGGWLLKREWLWDVAQRPLVRGMTTGWETHISAIMQGQGVDTVVLPYDPTQQSIWGALHPLQEDGLRTAEVASDERQRTFDAYRNAGWKLQREMEPEAEGSAPVVEAAPETSAADEALAASSDESPAAMGVEPEDKDEG